MRFHGGINTEKYLDFSVNVPAKELDAKAAAYMHQAIQTLHLYPSIYAEKQTKRLESLLGAPVVIGNGATQLIHAIGRIYRNAHVLIVEPTFTEYAGALKESTLHRVSCLDFSCPNPDNYGYRGTSEEQSSASCCKGNQAASERRKGLPKTIADAANETNACLVVLCNPNNPTGRWIPLEGIREILEVTHATLFVDESFVDFVDGIDLRTHQRGIANLIAVYPNRLIVLRSLTKSFSVPGLRIGYALGSAEIVNRILDEIEPWSLNAFALAFLDYMLDEDLIYKTQCNQFSEERNLMRYELESLGIKVFPSCTNFLLFRSREGLNEDLRTKGINIRVCADFPFLGEPYYRVTIRKREENRALIDALKGIDSLGGDSEEIRKMKGKHIPLDSKTHQPHSKTYQQTEKL